MAGPNITEAEVDLDVDGGAILSVIDLISRRINTIQVQLRKVVETAASGAQGFDKKLSDTVKALQTSLGQISTLEKTLNQGSKPITQANQSQTLARQTTQASIYAKTLKEATTAADALQARLNEVNKKIAGLGSQGQLAKRADLNKQLNTQEALKQVSQLESQLDKLDARARRTSSANFTGDRAAVVAAQAALHDATNDGRRTNFTAELQALSDAQARYAEAITAQRAKAAQSLTAYRQQARALAQDTSKEAEIEKAYRQQEAADRTRLRELVKLQAADEKAAAAERSANWRKLNDQELLGAEAVASMNLKALEADRANDADRLSRTGLVARQRVAAAKEQAIAEVKGLGQAKEREILDQQAVRSSTLIAAARERMGAATAAEARQLAELIELEKTRLKAINQETAAMDRQGARPNGGGAAPAGPRPTGLARVFNSDYIGAAIGRTAIYGGAAAIGYGAINATQQELKDVIEFEDKLKTLQAIAGATDTQLKALSGTILDVGKNSRYSLSDLADAATVLAQAGFSVSDMQKSLGAISTLAAASGSSLTQTVDVVTSAIGSFQLQTSETSRVTDVLLSALNRSKLTLTQVSEAIQYVGSTAYESNITLEQLVATAGALAQAGIKSGSTIGTGLRQFIIDLQTPSTKLTEQLQRLGISFADIDIKTRGLPAVIQTLSDKGFGAAQAYGALETRAAAAFLTLKNNLGVYSDLILAEAQQGAAQEANVKAMDSLTAQWQRFKNILQEVTAGAVQNTLTGLKAVVTAAGDALAKLNEMNSKKSEPPSWVPAWAKKDLSKPVGNALSNFGYGALNTFGQVGHYLEGDDYWVGAGDRLRAYADQQKLATAGNDQLATATANAADAANNQQQKVDSLNKEIGRLLLQHDSLSQNQKLAQAETVTLSSRFEGLALNITGATDNIYNLITALRQYRREQLGSLGTALTGEIGAIRNERSSLNQQGGQQIVGIRKSAGFNTLSAREQAAVANPTLSVNAQIISDAAARVAKQFPQLAQSLNSLSTTAGKYVTLGLQQQQKAGVLSQVNVAGSAQGQAITNQLEGIQARFQELQSGATGKTPAQRKGVFTALQAQVKAQIEGVKSLSGGSTAEQQFRANAISEFQSIANQISAIVDPTSKEAKQAARDAKKLTTQGQRAQRKFNINQRAVDETGVKADDLDLAGDLKDAGKAQTLAAFTAASVEVEAALAKWTKDRTAAIADEIKTRGLNDSQAAQYRREIAAQVEEKQETVARALADAFNKMVEAQIKAIQRAYDRKIAPAETSLGIAQGAAAGLNRASLAGQVPDFMKTLADRRVGLAQEALDNAKIPALEVQIKELRQQLDLVEKQEAAYAAKAQAGGPNAAGNAVLAGNAHTTAEGIRGQIDSGTSSLQELQAARDAAAEIPTTLVANLQKAAEAYRYANQTGLSFTQMLSNNMTDALSNGQGLLTNFFGTLIEKPRQALAAFGTMVAGILKYVQQLAAKLIASQIINLLISLAPTGAGAGGARGGAAPGASSAGINPSFAFNGGLMGYDTGGLVATGFRDHDSVNAKLARGEFVMRNKAVDSLGVDFLSRLNKHGASALADLAATPVMQMKPANQQMSVYLVAPETKPSLSKNDVLLVVQDDMLKGGQTKQLVKHISQGG